MVDIILLERVEKLGQMGQVVKVKPGFARNYLLPQKKALRATKSNLAFFETQKAQLQSVNAERRIAAEAAAGGIVGAELVIIRQAGESGLLYGSVSARDVAEAAKAGGYTIERRHVQIDPPIKTLGLFPVRIVLHPEVSLNVTVNVARSADEAKIQTLRGGAVLATEEAAEEEVVIVPVEVPYDASIEQPDVSF